MKPLRVAVAGAGMVSRHHLIAWSRCTDATIVGVADSDGARARERAREFGVGAVFDDTAAMLDAVHPDAIDIAAGHEAHAPLCELAARRGIAILCQKPLAPTLDAAARIAADVGDRVRLMVHENWRHRPYYRQLHAWLMAGAIGRPRHVALQVRGSGLALRPDGTRAALTRQPMLGGLRRLMIGEVLVHHLDVVSWLVGPLAVRAACPRRDVAAIRGESAATILLHGDDGCTVVVDGDLAVPDAPERVDDRLELLGTEGAIRLDDLTLSLSRPGAAPQSVTYDADASYQGAYDSAIAHFTRALLDGTPFETPPEVHLRVLALVEDAYRAADPAGWR
jgi:predicted dehydrogenase